MQLDSIDSNKLWQLGTEPAEEAIQTLRQTGLCRFNLPDAAEIALQDPEAFVERSCGHRPSRLEVLDVRFDPESRPSYVQGMMEAPLHTDTHTYPAHLQYLICKQPAASGGENFFVDTWKVAHEIQRNDPTLFKTLFEELRTFRFITGFQEGYTFSLSNGNLVWTHPPYHLKDDRVGMALHRYINRSPRPAFTLTEGETVMASNHRLLHGRTEFSDPGRHLIRILAWFDTPIEDPPAEFLELARENPPEPRVSI